MLNIDPSQVERSKARIKQKKLPFNRIPPMWGGGAVRALLGIDASKQASRQKAGNADTQIGRQADRQIGSRVDR